MYYQRPTISLRLGTDLDNVWPQIGWLGAFRLQHLSTSATRILTIFTLVKLGCDLLMIKRKVSSRGDLHVKNDTGSGIIMEWSIWKYCNCLGDHVSMFLWRLKDWWQLLTLNRLSEFIGLGASNYMSEIFMGEKVSECFGYKTNGTQACIEETLLP